MTIEDRDLGMRKILQQMQITTSLEVAVGVFQGQQDSDGVQIAEYGAFNEFGTDTIPSRPFMATAFDENVSRINSDVDNTIGRVAGGQITATQALNRIGQKHADRIKNTITWRNFTPRLADATIAQKKGSTKTLVDTGALVNAIHPEIRARQS